MSFETTDDEILKDFAVFYQTYLEPVQGALRSWLRVPQQDVDDLAQAFFTKVLEKDLLAKRDQVAHFRQWLFAALRNHVLDHYRREGRSRQRQQLEPTFDPADAQPVPGWGGHADDPDSLYALAVLNMTLQKMRFHCETSGKPEIWEIFDLWVRARVNDEGRSDTADELSGLFVDKERSFLWNRLTTAKRIFKRIVREVIPPALSDCLDPDERYEEWLDILRSSRAAKENRLHLAFCIDAVPPDDAAESLSINLAVRTELIRAVDAEPIPPAMRDDELRILLSFRLSTPLEYYVTGLARAARARTRRKGQGEAAVRPSAPPTLLTLLTPASTADGALEREDLYRLIKKSAKWNHNNAGDTMPPEISKVIYNLAIVLALTECGVRITDLKDANLIKNLRWLLSRSWLDSRLRPVFERGLKHLGVSQPADVP